ncbi:hypothetical protein BX616_004414 [Lobosporangium transversale]|uniref:Late embryogenesis abundant protein LEA-2 subgroup domain-containing protein n=1 Tax=Lobosporangium transversale TaxID=64571 RepID=A0A1Y2GN39_9FUNG|nr:hypothetical protein BCR41DRAFT_422180 [Lobosporangium transversale]KAF9918905.1 hypothetical protein BX616_004414 [Lobosporangium transversale]ORZ16179.1 hypothetical protein BCR41DRAFT_422180 [Lobosporangium transversale]|eukprot:XP_021881526.1 hypothetical protein BCR41DRAFT_422180 [Lobosporangium transversale]
MNYNGYDSSNGNYIYKQANSRGEDDEFHPQPQLHLNKKLPPLPTQRPEGCGQEPHQQQHEQRQERGWNYTYHHKTQQLNLKCDTKNEFEDDETLRTEKNKSNGENKTSDHSDNSNLDVKRMGPTGKISRLLPCFPCVQSACGRITCCLSILVLLALTIVGIVLAKTLQVPTLKYLGAASGPNFSFNKGNTTLAMTMVANIEIDNPNLLGFRINSAVIKAFYPNYSPPIGGGSVQYVDIHRKAKTVVQASVSISYDRHQDSRLSVIRSILSECGLAGGTEGQIIINYEAIADVTIIGIISISHTVKNKSYSVNCPINIREILRKLGDKAKEIITDIGDFIEGVVDDVEDFIDDVGDDFRDIIDDVGGSIGDFIDDL